jgi:hypothetical protein
LKKELTKTNSGANQDIKTGSAARRIHSENAAEDAINGAIDRISQVTLFGFVSHFKVFFI